MPTYSFIISAASVTYSSTAGVGSQVGIIGARQSLISTGTTRNDPAIYHGGTAQTFFVNIPEKLNTRSPAGNSDNYLDSMSGPNHVLVTLSQSPFNNSWWTSYYRCVPICSDDIDLLCVFLSTGFGQTGQAEMTLDEDIRSHNWSRGNLCRRRTRKPGYWNVAGNSICRFFASTIQFPQFQNDITWNDPSAWKNGHIQSDVWNINIFGTKLDEKMKVGTGI